MESMSMGSLRKNLLVLIFTIVFFALGSGSAAAQSGPPAAVTAACAQRAQTAGDPTGGSVASNGDGTYSCVVQPPDAPAGGSTFNLDSNGNLVNNSSGVAQSSILGNTNSAGQSVASPSNCDSFYSFFSSPITCIGRSMATAIGTAIIYLASWVLTVAGLLFDWAISETVMEFGNFVNTSVLNAINITWDAFRDISNIVIIGMFTFIAIMTILGSADYGAKKMISRVLIVAILINFSLLFTKIIIDASNFTADAFFTAAGGVISQTANSAQSGASSAQVNVQSSTGGTASGSASTPSSDIAGAFMQYAGAGGWNQTYNAISSIAQNQNQGGWIALTYGVVIGLLEIVAAVVLFYGTFLLITRALLMIFLMITSSIAFASYLIPSLSQNYGWSAWWSALLKNAVFAPLLAVLLWVTLVVAQAFAAQNQNSGGNLGALIASPTGTTNISSLFGYIIVIGLLFIAIRISASFSTQIAGINFVPKITVGAGALASRFGIAPIGRQLFGRASANKSRELGGELKTARSDLVQIARTKGKKSPEYAKQVNKIADLGIQKARADKRAKSNFNVMDRPIAKTITKAVGLKGVLTGQSPKKAPHGFEGRLENRAKEVAKTAGGLAISKEEQNKIREEARETEQQKIISEHKDALEQKKAIVDASQKQADEIKEQLEKSRDEESKNNPAYAQAKDEMEKAVKEGAEAGTKHEQTMKDLQSSLAKAVDVQQKAAVQAQIDNAEQAHKTDMKARNDKITNATNVARNIARQSNPKLEALEKQFDDRTLVLNNAKADLERAEKQDPTRLSQQEKTRVNQAGDEALKAVQHGTDEALKKFGEANATVVERITGQTHELGELTKKKFHEESSNKRIKEAFKDLANNDEGGADSHGETPPAAGGGH